MKRYRISMAILIGAVAVAAIDCWVFRSLLEPSYSRVACLLRCRRDAVRQSLDSGWPGLGPAADPEWRALHHS